MQSYLKLERESVEKNVDRAARAFEQLDDSLHDKSVDWASWDDSYQFMADHNKAYIRSNLMPTSVAAMKLDVILYVDGHGKIFHQFALKRFPELPPPNAMELCHTLDLDLPASAALHSKNAYSGVILNSSHPLLVSVRPILTSKGKGPSRGWLVFGRYFDKRLLRTLEDQTRLDLQIGQVDSPSITDRNKPYPALLLAAPIGVRPVNSHTIEGTTILVDVHKQPVLSLKVTLPRSIYAQGLASTTYLLHLILLAALVFSGSTLIVVEFSVLSRLSSLTRQVEQIGEDGTAAKRVVLSGHDELCSLAEQINGMLLKLEKAAQTLLESDEALRLQNENLESSIMERTEALLYQAFHDSLTGLPNRAQVLYHLQQLAETRKVGGKAVLFLDLDNFKFINDSLGHGAGDELLIAVSERLGKCVRPDDVVARLGGDEFLIVLDSIENAEAAIQVAERVLEIMNTGFSLTAGEGFTSASIGIAYSDSPLIDPEILIRDADTAMYHAKSNGKAAYALFETGMNDRLTERVAMEVGLRLALEQEEFCVHYQPLVDLKTGHLLGVEALVRWQHPELGLIPPGKFIPVAEEIGLIVPIGYWVLEEACRQAMIWKLAYPDHVTFITNVNLSGKQLQKPDVVERIQEILERTGLPPGELKIEITESVMMEDVEGARAKLTQLRSMGVKLALDDFGTGYSSMASLSTFPLNTVKIDQAFINRLNTHPDAESVVAAIIMLAKSLNMDVTGEGIENAEQVMRLQGLGCDIGQGYFFDRPLQAGALEDRMNKTESSFIKDYTEADKALIERLLAETDVYKLANWLKVA